MQPRRAYDLVRLAAISIAIVSLVSALSGSEIATHLRGVLTPTSSVLIPTDPNWTVNTTLRWNAYQAPTYIVSARPATDDDVKEIVQFAAKNSLAFLATGGGHGYTNTVSSIDGGFEIDLSNFNHVEIDTTANVVTVGGAVRFHNVTGPLFAAGREITVGECSCVGMMGATLGGGIGPYGGLHGLILDSLQSVRMITGTGELLTASASENSDLFWGMRGAGFNFGIVTSATYAIYNVTNGGYAMNADMRFDASKNKSIWEITKSFENSQPDALSVDIAVAYDEDYGGTYLLGNFIYAGPLPEGLDLIRPYLDLGPINQNISVIPWSDLETSVRFGTDAESCVKGRLYSLWSLNLLSLDVPTLVNVTNLLDSTFRGTPKLQFSIFAMLKFAKQVTQSVPDDATAYPNRNATYYAHMDVTFPDSSVRDAAAFLGQSVRDMLQTTSGYPSLQVYVNYAHGDEGPATWYGERKLPKLLELKQRYDPHLLFNHYNGLIQDASFMG